MIRIFPFTTRTPLPKRLLHMHAETGHAFWLEQDPERPGRMFLAAVELDSDGCPQWASAHVAERNVIRDLTNLRALENACRVIQGLPTWNRAASAEPQGVAA